MGVHCAAMKMKKREVKIYLEPELHEQIKGVAENHKDGNVTAVIRDIIACFLDEWVIGRDRINEMLTLHKERRAAAGVKPPRRKREATKAAPKSGRSGSDTAKS